MESILESADSYLYFLWISLPVGIAFGLLFFSAGYLLTNPRVRRLGRQVDHYREECARMSRSLAGINSQHQELLENLQEKEKENLVLQDSLETKDEELVGLLQRLNNVALETDRIAEDSGTADRKEIARLEDLVADLNGRLETSESALRDQKAELAKALEQLAQAGAIAGGEDHPSPAPPDQSWSPLSPREPAQASDSRSAATQAVSTAPKTFDPLPEPAEREASLAAAREARPETPVTQEAAAPEEPKAIAGSDAAEKPAEETPAAAAPAIESPAPAEAAAPATTAGISEPAAPAAVEKAAPETGTEFGFDALTDSLDKDAADLAAQFAEFEKRLREKESEFFSFQDTFSGSDDAPPRKAPAFNIIEPAPVDPLPDVPADSPESAPAAETETLRETATIEGDLFSGIDLGVRKPDSASSLSSSPAAAFPPLSEKEPPPIPLASPVSGAESSAAPLSNEEQLIFRGSDPSAWGMASAAGDGVVPIDSVSGDIRFLRIRRSDTGQSVVIPIRKDDLLTLAPGEGGTIGWNGNGESFESAYHLGVFDHSLPQEVETRFGAGGWGFGHFYGKRGGQAYCWAGITIAKTGFEISVLRELPGAETLRATDTVLLDSPAVGPSEEEELVFFQSAYPEIWNKNVVDGKGGFALNMCRLPRDTRYIKVRRVDNGSAVVVPVAPDALLGKSEDKSVLGWNGSNEFFFGGFHLGICDPDSANDVEIKYGCGGYGFGHLVDSNDCQAFAWAGRDIGRTAFEFSAIARPLTAAEGNILLGP